MDQVVVEIQTSLDRRVDMYGQSIFNGRLRTDQEKTQSGRELAFSPDACAALAVPDHGHYTVEADTGGYEMCFWMGEQGFAFNGGTQYVVLQLNHTIMCHG